jgi:hypothetical protein
VAVSQADFLKNYQQGIAGSGEKYKKRVATGKPWAENYSSPEAQAAMRDGLARAIEEGRPAAGAQALGTAGYRAKTIEKAGNYTASAARAAAAITPHIPQIIQAGEASRQAAAAVPGPKNRATAKAKMAAALDAVMDTWGKE